MWLPIPSCAVGHHGAGGDACRQGCGRKQRLQRLGEAQPRVGQGRPGQAAGAGQLLQCLGRLVPGGQQHGGGAAAVQGCAERVARFEEADLGGTGLVEGGSSLDGGVACQVVGHGPWTTGGLHFAQVAEQVAEAHGRWNYELGRIVERSR